MTASSYRYPYGIVALKTLAYLVFIFVVTTLAQPDAEFVPRLFFTLALGLPFALARVVIEEALKEK